jgi:precorrin-2 dehydrogenase/sirohydrochlorin ferrochelatase
VIPLLHDFTGEVVLVFGGGPVGARKARRFGREARVVVLSPAFADRVFEPDERRDRDAGVELVRAAPTPARWGPGSTARSRRSRWPRRTTRR